MTKIGISGTGFIATGLYKRLQQDQEFEAAKVLTRRRITEVPVINQKVLTNSIDDFLQGIDIVVECSGDVEHGSIVVEEAHRMKLPVVTMNAELQVTTGSYFTGTGYITEAEGDQPGSLAALDENVKAMGFTPLVYGNIKGFLNLNPSRQDMLYWAQQKGYSLLKVTSFTDGTKVQIEQALVANGLGAGITQRGLSGISADSPESGGAALAAMALEKKQALSDFIVSKNGPPGVFISGIHSGDQQQALSSYKMGDGPVYTLTTPFHLCHLEIVKTLRRVVEGKPPLLTNSAQPNISVAGIAKRSLQPGEVIEEAAGSFSVRGEACTASEEPEHVPIGLMRNVTVERPVKEGQVITFKDISIPDSRAMEIWSKIAKKNQLI